MATLGEQATALAMGQAVTRLPQAPVLATAQTAARAPRGAGPTEQEAGGAAWEVGVSGAALQQGACWDTCLAAGGSKFESAIVTPNL